MFASDYIVFSQPNTQLPRFDLSRPVVGSRVCVGRCVNIISCTVQRSENTGRCKRGRPAIDVLLVGGIQLGIRIVLIG
jgi:hypothetical protein